MRYAIITNPASGKRTLEQKRALLACPARILGAQIHGLDTRSAEELAECARELSERFPVLVVAGGDGTLSEVMNAVDTTRTVVAYLPLGTGNAMRHALGYRGNLTAITRRIQSGRIHEYDLIDCDGVRKGFMASVGIEGTVLTLRNRNLAGGAGGFEAYWKAFLDACFREYKPLDASISIDGTRFEERDLLTLMVVKQPYYGFGMNLVPKARFDDGVLHALSMDARWFKILVAGCTAFTIGNRMGRHRTAHRVTVKLDRPLFLQIDGNRSWEADRFTFGLLPRALKILH
jgi:diacylglycerol kinase family enzyme